MSSVTTALRQRLSSGTKVRALAAEIQNHPVLALFLLALVVRVSIAVFLTRFFSGTLILDDTTYHTMASNMAAGTTQNWDQFTNTLYWSTATLTVPLTLLYKLFGPTMLVGQLFVALCGATAVALAVRLALEVVDAKWAIVVGIILALMPSQAFWSSMLMKDALVWATLIGLATAVAIGGRSKGRGLAWSGIAVAVLLILLAYLRLHTLVVASWAVVLASLAGHAAQRWPRVIGALVLAITIPWLFGEIGPGGFSLVAHAGSLQDRRFQNARGANTAVIDVSAPSAPSARTEPDLVDTLHQRLADLTEQQESVHSQGHSLSQTVDQLETQVHSSKGSGDQKEAKQRLRDARKDLERNETRERVISQRRQELAERLSRLQENNGVPPPLSDEGGLDTNLSYLPRGMSVMLLEPFPVPFEGSLSLRLARLEDVIWYPLLILGLVGIFIARRELRTLLFPILVGAGIMVMYALTEGNVGTAHRHRGEFVWVVVLLAVMGIRHLLGRRSASAKAG